MLKLADRGEYHVLETFRETESGAKDNRRQRNKVIALAQSQKIDVILVSELSRWGRSTIDLLNTLIQGNNQSSLLLLRECRLMFSEP